MKQNVSTPEGVPRLFDLVKVRDERMKLAFFAALGNTVVAKDLDQVLLQHSCMSQVFVVIYAYQRMATLHYSLIVIEVS